MMQLPKIMALQMFFRALFRFTLKIRNVKRFDCVCGLTQTIFMEKINPCKNVSLTCHRKIAGKKEKLILT